MTDAVTGSKWQEAIQLCRDVLADRPAFEKGEVNYKHDIAANVQVAFAAAEAGDPMAPALKKALGSPNNLLFFVDQSRFRDWARDEDAASRDALLTLKAAGPVAARVDAFVQEIPPLVLKSPGAKIGFASFFLLGLDPAQFPMYRPGAIKGAEKILGWPPAPEGTSLGEEYQHHIDFVSHFRDLLREEGLDVRDLLDAQSLIWMLMKWGEPQFKAWRGEVVKPKPVEKAPAAVDRVEAATFDDLAEELYVDAAFLRSVVELLEDKRQLIFYGPPGTGKTYISRRLARFLADGDPQRTTTVQFHPSYSYEDFVQGYRPRSDERGSLVYELVDGPLVRLAARARQMPEERHVLLIDEINRGNLPRIFGELLYLLEYRDDEVALMYSREITPFSLPSNLWVIGTMNTADRSIGLIDAALRRRFHFKALFPSRPPLDGLLERWLRDHAPAMSGVAGDVDRLNQKLRERFGDHLQVGHSYFMSPDLDDARLERIWEVDILPFLEDQLFGKEDELASYRLAAIRRGADHDSGGREADAHADDQPDGIPAGS